MGLTNQLQTESDWRNTSPGFETLLWQTGGLNPPHFSVMGEAPTRMKPVAHQKADFRTKDSSRDPETTFNRLFHNLHLHNSSGVISCNVKFCLVLTSRCFLEMEVQQHHPTVINERMCFCLTGLFCSLSVKKKKKRYNIDYQFLSKTQELVIIIWTVLTDVKRKQTRIMNVSELERLVGSRTGCVSDGEGLRTLTCCARWVSG